MKDIGLDMKVPIYASGPESAGWWGVWITMLGDSTAFASLVFGYFFYWTSQSDFPPADAGSVLHPWLWSGTILLALAWWQLQAARQVNREGRTTDARNKLIMALIMTLTGLGLWGLALIGSDLDPVSHVYPAMLSAIALWTAVHIVIGLVMLAYAIAGTVFGKITAVHDADLANICLFWHFLMGTVVVGALTIGAVPLLMGA